MNEITPLMAGIGFNAIKKGAFEEASDIFDSVAETNPQDAAGIIGQATVKLSQGDIVAAIAILEGGMEKAEVNVHEARKLLLLTYMLEGDDAKAEQLHSAFVQSSAHESAAGQLQESRAFFNQV